MCVYTHVFTMNIYMYVCIYIYIYTHNFSEQRETTQPHVLSHGNFILSGKPPRSTF